MKSKNAYVIDFYEQFECIGGSCPYTCCKGWQIAVDDETYANYRQTAFPKNILYSAATFKKEGAIRCLRKIGKTCPFYTIDGLCRFQQKNNEKLMPKVCRQYPRTSISFGDYKEVTLELSCIRAAELFVENLGRHDFVESKEEIDENWTIGNNSQAFLDFLKADRNKIIDYIWSNSKSSIWDTMKEIYSYIYLVNQHLSMDDIEGAKRVHLPALEAEKSEYSIPRVSSVRAGSPFYPIWFLNEIIYEKLSHPNMKKNNRYLYNLIESFKKQFGELSEKEADPFFVEKISEMLNSQKELNQYFIAYYSYLIQQMYCKAYEDYYVLGQVLLAGIDVQFVMLFTLTYFMEHGHVEPADFAAILANTERALRHNLSLNDDILYKIRQKFFK